MRADNDPIRVSVPPGWAPTTLALATLDGSTRMLVTAEHLEHEESAADVADRVAERLSEQFPGITLEEPRDAGEALTRRFTIAPPGGVAVDRLQLYHAAGPLGYVATVSSTAALPSVEQEARLASLLARVDFAAGGEVTTFDFSTDELAVLAELAGRGAFPGLQGRGLGTVARLAARRALVARGTLTDRPDGPPKVDPAQAALVANVLNPHAVVGAERVTAGAREVRLYSVGARFAVVQQAIADGVIRLQATSPAALPLLVGEFLELGNRTTPPGAAIEVVPAELEELIRSAGRGEPKIADRAARDTLRQLQWQAAVRVRGRGGAGSAVDELRWLDCGAGGLWLIDSAGERSTLAPTSAVELADRLVTLLSATVGKPVA